MTVLRVYQKLISPLIPPACRFAPSCSEYTYQSVDRFGVPRGLYLALRRLLRCHPWHTGGEDPVPEK